MEKQNLNLEDIKVGETYGVRVKCIRIDEDGFYGFNTETKPSIFRLFNKKDVETSVFPLPAPENGIKNTETAPKYDPCRKFLWGDKVRVKREVHGRPVYIGEDAWEPLDPDEIWEVVEEKETGWVHLKNGCLTADVWHGMLELVTPVEEVTPYTIDECYFAPTLYVRKNGKVYMTIPYKEGSSLFQTREEALAAAEAERDRLNAEYRKEREND